MFNDPNTIKTVDPKYDKEETQILSLESALRTLQVDIMSSVEERDVSMNYNVKYCCNGYLGMDS